MMSKFRLLLNFALPLTAWGFLSYRFISQGNNWAAIFTVIPFIAFLLFIISPNKGPGAYAFKEQLGPDVVQEEETIKEYSLRMAKWWFLGSLTLPLSIIIAYIFDSELTIIVPFSFLGILFGIACFLKGIGALIVVYRNKAN